MDISRVLEDLGLDRVRLGRGDLSVYSPIDGGDIGRLQQDSPENIEIKIARASSAQPCKADLEKDRHAKPLVAIT